MLFGGIEVEDRLVLRLATEVRHETLSRRLQVAWTLRARVLNLTTDERQTVLDTLDDAPHGLEGLRERLLTNATWRARQRR